MDELYGVRGVDRCLYDTEQEWTEQEWYESFEITDFERLFLKKIREAGKIEAQNHKYKANPNYGKF